MNAVEPPQYPHHPRTRGWVGTTAMAMGGSNQSLFLMAALFVGQGDIVDVRGGIPALRARAGEPGGHLLLAGHSGAPETLGTDLAVVPGPTFAPLFGSAAKAAAIWFMMLNMFHGTVQPLAGAARTLWQLAADGLVPRALTLRSRTDAPWVATVVTAAMAIFFLLIGDPIWFVAAASLTYLIGIGLPSVAVWLLRRDAPAMERPYRAPDRTITLGVVAA